MRATVHNIAAITIIIVVATPALGFLFAYVEHSRSVSGFQSFDTSNATKRASILATSCVIGILSKFIFDRLSKLYKTKVSFIGSLTNAFKAIVIAMIVSPIIIVGLYGLLEKIEDTILLALIAYQNGFFFQSVLGKTEPNQGTLI